MSRLTRAIVFLICALTVACGRFSYEAVIEEFKNDDEPRLMLRAVSGESGNFVVYQRINRDPSTQIETNDLVLGPSRDNPDSKVPSYCSITDKIRSGDKYLTAKDLRVGHRIRVSYSDATNCEQMDPTVEVINYVSPDKILELSFTIDISSGNGPLGKNLSESRVRSQVIAHLSWLLPDDIGIAESTDLAAGVVPVGKLQVAYSERESDSMYVTVPAGSKISEVRQIVVVDTLLTDRGASTNWSHIESEGWRLQGFYESRDSGRQIFPRHTLSQVPRFELRTAK